MRKLYQSFVGLLSGLFILSGCSMQEEPGISGPDDTGLPPYSVTFHLEGSVASAGAATRAEDGDTPIHNEQERALHSLYAVVFEDADAADGFTTGQTSTEAAGDKFYAAFPVDLSGYNSDPQSNPVLTFSVAKAGNFQVCFLANPSGHPADEATEATGLVAKLNALEPETSTVADFKALLEEDVLGDATPITSPAQYIMTSPFYTLATKYVNSREEIGPENITSVVLTRAMARFDIINTAHGYTITDVVFHNRAVTTDVISDNPEYKPEYVVETTAYNSLNLEGNPDTPAAYEAHIYSFEQYAGSTEETFREDIEGLPYFEINYKVPSISADRVFTRNVYLKKAKPEPAEDYQVLTIKRNYLYKIKMTSDPGSDINFQIEVLDWNEGDTIQVTDGELVGGLSDSKRKPLEDAAIGDFYMADGTLVAPDELKYMDRGNVIGIVFQTYKDAPGRFETDMETLGGEPLTTPHGLVMAAKQASSGTGWGPWEGTSLPETNTLALSYQDVSGWSNWHTVGGESLDFEDYEAFNVVSEFSNTVPAPQQSTGWFLPSIGQWWDFVANLGGMATELESSQENVAHEWFWYYSVLPENAPSNASLINKESSYVQNTINSHLSTLGEGYYDKFEVKAYWSSSEADTRARFVKFEENYFTISDTYKIDGGAARAVLAF